MNSSAPKTVFQNSPHAIVFDCDGVVFNSKDSTTGFYTYILEKLGRPPVRPDQEQFINMYPVREALQFLVGPGPAFDEALACARQIDFERFNSRLEFEPGLLPLLDCVKSSFKTAMATNRAFSTLRLLAKYGIKDYFDLVVSASDVTHPKPHPESMERIMNTFGVSAAEVVYIGDSMVDESFAANTGVFFVAYKNRSLEANIHIGHLDELRMALECHIKNHASPSGTR